MDLIYQLITDPRSNKLESRIDAHYNKEKNIHGGGSDKAFVVKLDPFLGLSKRKQKVDDKDFSDFKIFKKMQFGYLVEKESKMNITEKPKSRDQLAQSVSGKPRRKDLKLDSTLQTLESLNPPKKIMVFEPGLTRTPGSLQKFDEQMGKPTLKGTVTPKVPSKALQPVGWGDNSAQNPVPAKEYNKSAVVTQLPKLQSPSADAHPTATHEEETAKYKGFTASAVSALLQQKGIERLQTVASAAHIPRTKWSLSAMQQFVQPINLPKIN